MSKILIIAGGNSDERDVSLRSGLSVKRALESSGHEVSSYDPAEANITLDNLVQKFDVLFPVLHGKGGEDGSLQQKLDQLAVPYVGSDTAASRLCFDKNEYRRHLEQGGYPVAPGGVVTRGEFYASALAQEPYVLKPYDGGSSIDTIIASNPATISDSIIAEVFAKHDKMLIESYIAGIEITVAVLGKEALPVVEIIPPAGAVFDYANKYNGATQELCPPAHVSDSLQQEARRLAAEIHDYCGCSDYSRTDMILTTDGKLFVLETNTLPGMTDQSLYPKAALAAGLDMGNLCQRLIELAMQRQTGHA